MKNIKNIPGKIAKRIKQTVVSFVVRMLRKKRLGRNSHDLQSVEITTLRQHMATEKPSQPLLDMIARISSAYSTDSYIPPANRSTVWDKYNSAYIGEHYRLLPLIVKAVGANKVVEIGTFKGASAEAILRNTNATVISYDLYSCKNFKDCYVSENYFTDRFTERIGDLYKEDHLKTLLEDIQDAQFIFLDGPKNFHFEKYIFDALFKATFTHDIWIMIDDIRVSTMVDLWNAIPYPKADISFLGHWSGTGLVYIPKRS